MKNSIQMPLRIPKSLHSHLKKNADKEGVSLNQYCLYILSQNMGLVQKEETERLENLLSFLTEAHFFQKEMKKNAQN